MNINKAKEAIFLLASYEKAKKDYDNLKNIKHCNLIRFQGETIFEISGCQNNELIIDINLNVLKLLSIKIEELEKRICEL